MSPFVFSCMVVGLFVMIFVTPSMMAIGVNKLGQDRLSAKEYILSCIPVFNQIYAEKIYYDKLSLGSISVVTFVAGVGFRVFAWLKMYDNETMALVSMIVFWAVVCFYFLAQMIFVYRVLNDTMTSEGIKLLFLAVFYPIGQYYIGSAVPTVVKNMNAQANTFI